MFLPQFDVPCDLLLHRRTATWNLFVLYNKETYFFYFIIFQHNLKIGLLSTLKNTIIAIWCHLWSIQNEANWLVAMCSKELWFVWGNHTTVNLKLSIAFHGMKIYSKIRIELQNSQILCKNNAGKVKLVSVIRAPLWAEKTWMLHVPWILQELKKLLGKLAVVVNINTGVGSHSIRLLNKRSVSDGGNLCPLWLVIIKCVWYSVWDNFYM